MSSKIIAGIIIVLFIIPNAAMTLHQEGVDVSSLDTVLDFLGSLFDTVLDFLGLSLGSGTPDLYIPVGQSLTGAIQVRGSDTYYSVDSETLRAYGGAPLSGYTWTVASLSALPPGTAVDPLTGIFHSSGGKLVSGTYTFDMTVSDGSRTATGTFTFVVNTGEIVPVAVFQQPAVSFIPLPDANTGYGYGASLWALGNDTLPWSWYLATGELPPGLVIDQAKGVVRGTPHSSAAGNTYSFTITVKDKTGEEALIVGPGLQPPTYTISVPR